MTYGRRLTQQSGFKSRGVAVQSVELRFDVAVDARDWKRRNIVVLAIEVLEGSHDVRGKSLDGAEDGAALVLAEGGAGGGVACSLLNRAVQRARIRGNTLMVHSA